MIDKYEEDFFNIFDFLILLYKKKLTLILFVIFGIFIGYFFKTQSINNQSVISITINNEPVSYKKSEVYNGFRKMFFKKDVFDGWKNNRETLIKFDDIRNDSMINGILISRPTSEMMVHFKTNDSKVVAELNVKDLNEANDIFSYFEYLNLIVSKEYNDRLQKEKKILENIIYGQMKVSSEETNTDKIPLQIVDATIYSFLGIDRFISKYKNNDLVFSITRPTELSDNSFAYLNYLMTIIFFILGIIFIVFIEGFKNHIKKINNNLDK